jgi:hypothetical protein
MAKKTRPVSTIPSAAPGRHHSARCVGAVGETKKVTPSLVRKAMVRSIFQWQIWADLELHLKSLSLGGKNWETIFPTVYWTLGNPSQKSPKILPGATVK